MASRKRTLLKVIILGDSGSVPPLPCTADSSCHPRQRIGLIPRRQDACMQPPVPSLLWPVPMASVLYQYLLSTVLCCTAQRRQDVPDESVRHEEVL